MWLESAGGRERVKSHMVAGGIISLGLRKKKKLVVEQRNQSLFKEKSPRLPQPCDWGPCAPSTAAPHQPVCAPPQPGCGPLFSPAAAASLRCRASRTRFVFQCGHTAGTRWHRWVRARSLYTCCKIPKVRHLQKFWNLGCLGAEWVAVWATCCMHGYEKRSILLHFKGISSIQFLQCLSWECLL